MVKSSFIILPKLRLRKRILLHWLGRPRRTSFCFKQLLVQQSQSASTWPCTMTLGIYSNKLTQPCKMNWQSGPDSKENRTVLQHLASQTALEQEYISCEMTPTRPGNGQPCSKQRPKKWQPIRQFLQMVRRMSLPALTLIDHPFGFDIAFKAFQQKHAQEFQDLSSLPKTMCGCLHPPCRSAGAEEVAWRSFPSLGSRKNASVLSSGAKSAMQSLVAQFADLTFRTEQPEAISRHEKQRAKRAKQREELTKAEAEFDWWMWTSSLQWQCWNKQLCRPRAARIDTMWFRRMEPLPTSWNSAHTLQKNAKGHMLPRLEADPRVPKSPAPPLWAEGALTGLQPRVVAARVANHGEWATRC